MAPPSGENLGALDYHLNIKGCPTAPGRQIYKMADRQVNISVSAKPYMAGTISQCNFRDTATQGKSNILSTVQIKLYTYVISSRFT